MDIGEWTFSVEISSGARLPMLQLTTSYLQRLNSGKPLDTGCYEWLWSIATWANGTLKISLP